MKKFDNEFMIMQNEENINNEKILEEFRNNDFSNRDKLILNNMRLANSLVKKYKYSLLYGSSIDVADLYQTAYSGLVRAVDTFDYKQNNCKFSTYASVVIKHEILNELNKNLFTLKYTQNVRLEMWKIIPLINKYEEKMKNFDELYNVIISEVKLNRPLSRLDLQDIINLRDNKTKISIDYNLSNDNNEDSKSLSFANTIRTEDDTEKEALSNTMIKDFKNSLKKKDYQDIFILYFIQGYTINEIGKLFNCTHQNISSKVIKIRKLFKEYFLKLKTN